MFRHQQPKEDVLEKTFLEYLGCHPTYTLPLIRAHNFIMRDIGPLSPNIRYYVAILASSRHRCSYLVNLLKKQFQQNGGDIQWLRGIEFAPEKLQQLNKINKILAHQPWLFKASHIQLLTKNLNSWSLPELTHAIIIMAHFHSVCSLAFGCKFGFEPPENFCQDNNDGTDGDEPASKLIVERCRQLEQSDDVNLSKIMNSFTITGKRKHKRYFQSTNNNNNQTLQSPVAVTERIEESGSDGSGSPESNQMDSNSITATSDDNVTISSQENEEINTIGGGIGEYKENSWSEDEWIKHGYDVFIDDPEFGYIDFAKRGRTSDTSTYRIQDYQWDDQGYSLSNYLYPDIGSFLDEKFKVGYNLTYYTLGPKTNVDTSPFRRAVWNYIQSIYGIRYDDYNYREVNILLERQLKCYIKHLGCFPELTGKHDYRNVMKGFRNSEKVHVIIMVAEARLQAEVLYAMRALMDYLKLSG